MGFKNIMKGFRKPKKLTRAQQEKQAQAEAFFKDYEDICAKHKLQLRPVLANSESGGMEPQLRLIPFTPPQQPNLISWATAQEQNLESAKKCRHKNEGERCIHCGVRAADQNYETGVGVTEAYVTAKLEKIEIYKKKEAEHNGEDQPQNVVEEEA